MGFVHSKNGASTVPARKGSPQLPPLTRGEKGPGSSQPSVEFEDSQKIIQADEDDPDGDNFEALGLHTGEDAIEFFGYNGMTSDVKVLFLNRPPPSVNFRPYDLLVVSRKKTGPEYFTMSAAGVTHICPNVPSQFIRLGEWWRQSSLFNTLRMIPFFKKYLQHKTYTLWNSNVRYRKYSGIRNKLTKKLFLSKRSFCSTLLELNRQCYELTTARCLSYSTKHTYTIEEFAETQVQQRQVATKSFEVTIDKIQSLLEKACEDVSSRVRPNEDKIPTEETSTRVNDKSKSMYQVRMETMARARALELARQEASMLPSLIRLADYMVVENLLLLILSSTAELYNLLMSPPKKTGLFLNTVSFGEAGIDIRPEDSDVTGMTTTITDLMVQAVCSVPRLLYMQNFKQLFKDLDISGPHLQEMVRSSLTFSRIREGINRIIHGDFAKCRDSAQQFIDFKMIHTFCNSFDVEAFANQDHVANARPIKREMLKLKQWGNELDRMKLTTITGIFHMDSKTLRNSLVGEKDKCLELMKTVLHTAAREAAVKVLNDFQLRIKNLTKKPANLKEFATFVEGKNSIEAEFKTLMAASSTVDDMYKLLGQFDVKIPPQEQVKLDDLHVIGQTFVEHLQAADGEIAQRMPSMSAQLDKNTQLVNEELLSMITALCSGPNVDATEEPSNVLEQLAETKETVDAIQDKITTFTGYQKLFRLIEYDYSNMTTVNELYDSRLQVWSALRSWEEQTQSWLVGEWSTLQPEEMLREHQVRLKEAVRMFKKNEEDGVAKRLKEWLEVWKAYMPTLVDLGNPALRPRHWKQIFDALGQPLHTTFTLDELMEWKIFDHKELVSEISGVASGEYALELQLEKVDAGWADMNFTVSPYREYKDVFILTSLDELFVQLEDHQAALQTMLASRFVMGIRDSVEEWDKRLALLSETLDEWLTCQRNWMYLESIFGAPDIQKQLPAETVQFLRVDQNWKDQMRRAHRKPNVIETACAPTVLTMFQEANAVLERIQKSLEDYLETKRSGFPRFYFLSNDELLEILAQTRDPTAVRPHLRKCFDCMSSVEFVKGDGKSDGMELDTIYITKMESPEGEQVALTVFVSTGGNVEGWMGALEETMRRSLFDNMQQCLQAYTEESREAWFFEWPAQCVLTVDQIIWQLGISNAIAEISSDENPRALKEFKSFSIEQINRMVAVVRGQLTPIQRSCMCNLIVIDVHARDVVDRMINDNCQSLLDFSWICQLRYYWESDVNDCQVKQTNSVFFYAYEYLGVVPRLVITPLTDKCFMTLTGALTLILGGAPAGPAGTGKTESVKDLGKALAQQVVVFNCSDGLDYKMMGRFFSGLAQAGAWACFDEFNRIDIEVLSVIAQQIMTIQQALKNNVETFMFEGREIQCNKNYGAFITMNPGYAGRTELPDNLKALFRPMAMMVPDYALIAEIMLFSEGFQGAKELARKMTSMYRLASEQLSQQDHYDFGMRAVKSVLVMAGQLKRENPDVREDLTLMRALRDSNVPKFLADDIPLFMAIVSDLFPGVEIPKVDYGGLQSKIEFKLRQAKLQIVPNFVGKIIQLYETMQVRHGVMMVGVTCTGKSTVVKTLSDAMTALHEESGPDADKYETVQRSVLNPKAITMGELYGEFNLMTNEWTDGLIATIVRMGVAATDTSKKWVICDGPVDAIWIESMNTVLDDNKTLCLNNGERIKLPKTMAMVFEVNDLSVASPATVSRCGMVYMEAVYLGWRPLAASWAENIMEPRFSGAGAKVMTMLDQYVDICLDFIRRECRENVQSTDTGLVMNMLNLLASMLPVIPKTEAQTDEEHAELQLARMTEMFNPCMLFSFVWGLGGNLHDTSLAKFDTWVRENVFRMTNYPEEGSVYDYIITDDGKYKLWADVVLPFEYDPEASFFNLIVPTVDTTRVKWLANTLMKGGYHLLLSGNSGVGKTIMLQDWLATCDEKFTSASKNFSAQTSASNLQAFFEEKLEKLRKNLLGPPTGKTMVLFIDDLNMPIKETYGAQPPIELIRQIINTGDDKQGGFYDRKKVGLFKRVRSTQFIAACCPPGGGRQEVTLRLLRHFFMLNNADLTVGSMRKIFLSITEAFLGHSFPASHQAYAAAIVDGSIEVYTKIAAELLPTPNKSHYTFNLRDLAKVVQGILMVEPNQVPETDALVRLWCHECARVFQDRLVDMQDKKWFTEVTRQILVEHFKVVWESDQFEHVIFGDWMSQTDKTYIEITDMEKANKQLMDYSEDYTLSTNKPMSLVFFRDAIQHLSRVCRVLRQPRGNALLVGVGGSGRQSLAKLACHIAECKVFLIELSRGYGPNEFHEDLKKVLMAAGKEATAFIFSDTQLVQESFLEDINNILNAGEVPDLFAKDEMEKIIEATRPRAKAAGKLETRDVIYQHFVQLVRENLHVILAMSPIGDAFRNRLRMFPSLVNCCTIDWYTEWPEDALVSVAQKFLEPVDLGDPKVKEGICRLCNVIHSSVSDISKRFLSELRRNSYTTPTSYLELINLYLSMLSEQRGINSGKIARYRGGVDKLITTNDMVSSLKEDLTKLQPVLAKAAKDTAILMEEVAVESAKAKEEEAVVMEETTKVNAVVEEAEEIKVDAQKDLDEAMPAVEAAVVALRSLNKNDITEIKSFAKPPAMVQTVMEGVCILKNEKPDWDTAKRLLSNANFLSSLETHDKDKIKESTTRKLQKYIKDPNFTPDNVEKVSKAAKSLCMWVIAMDTYARVAKSVEPKRQRLLGAEKKVSQMQKLLKEKTAKLEAAQAVAKELQDKLEDTERKRDELQTNASETEARLVRAEQLISGLGGEQVRWSKELEQLNLDRDNLIGNVLIASGIVAYAGPYTAVYRQELVDLWVKRCTALHIPADPAFDLQRIIGDPVVIREWNVQGLPSDKLSVENGMIMTRGRRWPLMIDPQTQANRWIRNTERPNHLQVIKLTESTYLRTLENCIRVGNPVLLENVEERLDPALEPVLQKQVFKNAGRLLIRLGDTDVDYSPDFRFFITTKLPNPHYPPEVCVKVTVVNFTVTPRGLEDQLLTQVVGFERPELEQEKSKLVIEIAAGQKTLQEIEDKILHMLANSSGNILDDSELISTLADSKTTSTQVNEQVRQAEETKILIDDACEGYRPVATRGSILYFVVADLGGVDPMYQYSLQYFMHQFHLSMQKTDKNPDLEVRVESLIVRCTADIYTNICRGLFEKDKKLFSFLILVQMMRNAGTITQAEWSFFLNKGGMVNEARLPNNPCSEWLPKSVWGAVQNLQTLKGFDHFAGSIIAAGDDWRAWYESDRPFAEPLPGRWQKSLNRFQRLLVLRTIREEKVVEAVNDFILGEMGTHFVESPPFDLSASYKDSNPTTPIVFVLSPGADPTGYLLLLADSLGVRERLRMISLGQGQGPIAQKMMEAARDVGDWVLLGNCHLAASWMPELEKLLEQQNTMKLHEDFRLWLTSMPSKAFPVSVLQSGIKLTNEPPKGLRANVKRTYEDMTEKQLESCSKPGPYKKLMFGVAFFHAVCQERRKFGPIGWNIPYEWNQSDIQTAQANLKMYLDEQDEVPYETLRYVLGDVNYGGRITDVWDQRCARSILAQYIDPAIMDDKYKFTEDGVYYAPPEGDILSYRAYIDQLPLQDTPQVFGLHRNANITFEAKETRYLIDTIISTQPKAGGTGDGEGPDQVVSNLVEMIQNKMPPRLLKNGADPSTFAVDEAGAMNSMGTFLLIEMAKFNKLLARIDKTLGEMDRAIRGLVVMSADLEGMYSAFLYQRVPDLWSSVAYLSQMPLGSWFKDLSARVAFLNGWIMDGPPAAFWMSAFFFPQGFMTAALQSHARAMQIAIDTLDFRTEVRRETLDDIMGKPEAGVYIYGLFLEGARWDSDDGILAESNPGELFTPMPVILLEPIILEIDKPVVDEDEEDDDDYGRPPGDGDPTYNVYACPLYKVSSRAGTLSTTGHSTNFVRMLDVPTAPPPLHWVRRGVALLSQLDD